MKKIRGDTNLAGLGSENNKQIVRINEIIFKGKQHIDWKSVKEYALRYIGKMYMIAHDGEQIYIDQKFADEFSGSIDTKRLRGACAKAKANAVQIVKELLEISDNPRYIPNYEEKHGQDAKFGWYRYDSRFSMPIYENEKIVRYNVFKITTLIRHADDGKKYLYDMVNIKKETEYTA
ncbi:MAG: hypothetical protein NC429_12520 [Lachnospiraceae bacterium]|nr:hypothetical protein [Lachnospiraceae bacterium]